MSQQSLSLRFNAVTNSVKEDTLHYFTNINYDTHFAFAALIKEDGEWKGVATARIIQDTEDPSIAEWAAIVLDKYHGLGIGSCLLYCLSVVRLTCVVESRWLLSSISPVSVLLFIMIIIRCCTG